MGLDWQLKNEAVLPTLAPPPRGTSPRRSHRVFTPVLQAFPHTLPAPPPCTSSLSGAA